MRIQKTALAAAISIALSGAALAQAPATVPGPNGFQEPANPPPVKSAPPGPYAVTIEADPALKTHTIYRPTDLAAFGGAKKLPIVAWGNGSCANRGRAAQVFLSQIVSYGYIAISAGVIDAPTPARPGGPPPGAGAPASAPAVGAPGGPARPNVDRTGDDALKLAIDWAIAENARAGSPLTGKLDTKAVAVMGTSCGGLQAIVTSPDPRVKTTIAWNSGTFPAGSANSSISRANHETLKQLHAPIAYITGGPVDIAQPNAEGDFAAITTVPVFFGAIDVGHGGTFRQPNGGRYGEVAVAWLDWQLKGDKNAGKMFEGADCTLCKDSIWTVKKKNMK